MANSLSVKKKNKMTISTNIFCIFCRIKNNHSLKSKTMKKIALFAFVCIALVFTGCKREQHAYNASMEYHFANHDDEVAVKAVLKTLSTYWEGDYTWNGVIEWADAQAETRFSMESYLTIYTNFDSKFKQYFHEGDYMTYTLKRNEDNKILWQYKFTQNGSEEIVKPSK